MLIAVAEAKLLLLLGMTKKEKFKLLTLLIGDNKAGAYTMGVKLILSAI